MFTGIVQSVGTVVDFHVENHGAKVVVDTGLNPAVLRIGDSIAVDGCCQTIEQFNGGICVFHALQETLNRTVFGTYRHGRRVNIEPALALGERLGGHLVQGHVDCTGKILKIARREGDMAVTIERPRNASAFPIIEKGSVAISGISLTVAEVTSSDFTVCIIPHTWEHTALQFLSSGEAVNLEADLIGKYVMALAAPYSSASNVTMDMLRDAGF